MAYKEMKVANTKEGGIKSFAFEYEVSLASVTTSDWILIPDDVKAIQMTLSVGGGGKGKVQFSTDNVDTVKTGSPIAIDWPAGEVAVNTADSAKPATAFRLNQTFAGTTKLTLRAQ